MASSGFYPFPVRRFSSMWRSEEPSNGNLRTKGGKRKIEKPWNGEGKNENRERENGTNDRVSLLGFAPEINHVAREILMGR